MSYIIKRELINYYIWTTFIITHAFFYQVQSHSGRYLIMTTRYMYHQIQTSSIVRNNLMLTIDV